LALIEIEDALGLEETGYVECNTLQLVLIVAFFE
jgi:hypothetical protein